MRPGRGLEGVGMGVRGTTEKLTLGVGTDRETLHDEDREWAGQTQGLDRGSRQMLRSWGSPTRAWMGEGSPLGRWGWRRDS